MNDKPKVYIFSEKKNTDVLPSVGISEDQIGEAAWAEDILDHLIEQYLLNIRFQARDFDFANGEEYENAMRQIEHVQEFQSYVHELVKEKQEYDLNKVIADAEAKAAKKMNKENGNDMLE